MLRCARVVLYAGLLALSPALLADTATPPAPVPAASKLKEIEAMMSRSEVDEAIEAAQAWTEAEPNSADAWYMLGRTNGNKATRVNMFSAAGLAGDSREAYEKAVELDPGHVRARYDLIQFYMMAPGFMGGSEDKAAEMAAALEQLDAVWGHIGRAYIALRGKDNEAAARHYEAVLALDPVHPQALNTLISLLIGAERLDDARAVAARALEHDPDNAIGHYQLARYSAVTGKDLETGLSHMERFLALPEKPASMSAAAAHWRRGQILEQLGRKDEAIAAFSQAVAMDDDLEEAAADLKRLKRA